MSPARPPNLSESQPHRKSAPEHRHRHRHGMEGCKRWVGYRYILIQYRLCDTLAGRGHTSRASDNVDGGGRPNAEPSARTATETPVPLWPSFRCQPRQRSQPKCLAQAQALIPPKDCATQSRARPSAGCEGRAGRGEGEGRGTDCCTPISCRATLRQWGG